MANKPSGILNLRGKKKAFVVAYLAQLARGSDNAAAAARAAGYSPNNPDNARIAASKLLADPKVRQYIEQYWEEKTMAAGEVMARLTAQARSPQGSYFRSGEFELERFIEDGYGHLIKKVWTEKKIVGEGMKVTGKGDEFGIAGTEEWIEKRRIEFYDGQTALVWIGKHHKLFTEKTELSNPDGSLDPQLDGDTLARVRDTVRDELAAFEAAHSAEAWDAASEEPPA